MLTWIKWFGGGEEFWLKKVTFYIIRKYWKKLFGLAGNLTWRVTNIFFNKKPTGWSKVSNYWTTKNQLVSLFGKKVNMNERATVILSPQSFPVSDGRFNRKELAETKVWGICANQQTLSTTWASPCAGSSMYW